MWHSDGILYRKYGQSLGLKCLTEKKLYSETFKIRTFSESIKQAWFGGIGRVRPVWIPSKSGHYSFFLVMCNVIKQKKKYKKGNPPYKQT